MERTEEASEAGGEMMYVLEDIKTGFFVVIDKRKINGIKWMWKFGWPDRKIVLKNWLCKAYNDVPWENK